MYNQNQLCNRGNIEVTGSEARRAAETSCGSFHERQMDAVSNSVGEGCGCEKIQISCKAESCTYNDSCKCTASAIDISGSNASASQDTECSTFYCGSCK